METEKIICPNCIEENDPGNHFCTNCQQPLSSLSTVDPIMKIQSLGYMFRCMAAKPNAVVCFVAILYLIVSSTPLIAFANIRHLGVNSIVPLLLCFVNIAVCGKIIYNYFRNNETVTEKEI